MALLLVNKLAHRTVVTVITTHRIDIAAAAAGCGDRIMLRFSTYKILKVVMRTVAF